MTFSTTIQTYNGTHAVHDNSVNNCAVDWANNKLWMVDGTNLSLYGIVTGSEGVSAPITNYPSAGGTTVGWDQYGHVYIPASPTLTYGGIAQIDNASLTYLAGATFPAPNFGGGNIVSTGGATTMLSSNVGNSVVNLNNCSTSNSSTYLNQSGWPNGNDKCFTTPGKDGSGLAFMLTGPNEGFKTQIATLQKIDVSGGFTVIGTYVPGDFLGGATEAFYHSICVDQTDGNPIFTVGADNGVIGFYYLVKIDSVTGSIIWKTQLSANAAGEVYGGQQFGQSRVLHQRLMLLQNSPVSSIVIIDTYDGSILSTQTTGLNGLTIWGQYSSDDTSGAIIGMFDLNSAAGGPTLLNSSTYGFRGWAALYVAPAYVPPVGPIRRWGTLCRTEPLIIPEIG